MRRLWTRFAEIYGHRWVSQFGDSHGAMSTWQKGLADLSREELGTGLRALLTRADPWPPSLPEFRQLCRPPQPHPAHVPVKRLPKPKPNPERAARAFQEMKSALNSERTPCKPSDSPAVKPC